MSGRVVTLKTKVRPRARKPARGAPSIAVIVQALRDRIGRQDVAPGAKLGEQELKYTATAGTLVQRDCASVWDANTRPSLRPGASCPLLIGQHHRLEGVQEPCALT